MSTAPKLLVVDDEQVVCKSCERIFESEGFKVDTCTDSWQGLRLASGEDYDAVLLDIRIPGMDGLEFLDRLRQKNSKIPVIIITGYSSVQSAAAAMRLSAADYIAKPFTPDEITTAVRRIVPKKPELVVAKSEPAPEHAAQTWQAAAPEYRFVDESWQQLGTDGSVRVGAFVSPDESAGVESITLPRVGDVVYRGLPLAALNGPGTSQHVLPAPLTGEVLEVNRRLEDDLSALIGDPCQTGWIARIKPSATDEDSAAASPRRMIFAAVNDLQSGQQRNLFAGMGCEVTVARESQDILPRLREVGAPLLVVDGRSFGDQGPQIVQAVGQALPDVKVVVIGDPAGTLENAYRRTRIHYYAVETLAGKELTELLCTVYRPPARKALAPLTSAIPLWINRIRITNRQGKKVSLLAARGLIRERDGLGQMLVRTILEKGFPLTLGLGNDPLSPLHLRQEAGEVDQLVLLGARDMGQLPGSLVRDVPSEIVDAAGDAVKGKISTLAVQPPATDGTSLVYDARITENLAQIIVRELATTSA
ncbi:MAG: response regulator [Deltaproteobacteria bacterium]|nr:response regulator [Deltaproteobacteria bacterium]